jgi:predicted transcriptional regulator
VQNRESPEIVRNVFWACNNGSRLTQVMLLCDLSQAQAKRYLTEMAGSGFIVYDPEDKKYRCTAWGFDQLQSLQAIEERVQVQSRSTKRVA